MTSAKRKKYLKTILGSAALAVFFFYLAKTGGCHAGDGGEYAFSGAVMGTTYHVKVVSRDVPLDAGALAASVQQALEDVDAKMSTYKPDSEVSRFNRHDSREPFTVSPETLELFSVARDISRETGGAFDITVGPLVNAWGFGPDGVADAPSEAELEALRAHVGYQLLEFSDSGDPLLAKRHRDVYCDLSAIAKGFGVDQAAGVLDEAGVENYMIEVGGEVSCRGVNASGVPWRIGIERPATGPERDPQRILALENIALATSGGYRNFYIGGNGQRRSHTIDPRTGYPVSHNLASVSVFHKSCARADAYATALLVLGPEEGMRFATEHGLAALFLVRNEDGGFDEQVSPVFRTRFGG